MDGLHNNTICGVIDGEHKSTSSHPEPSEKHLPFKKRLCNRDAVTNLNMRRDETAGDTVQKDCRSAAAIPITTNDDSLDSTCQGNGLSDATISIITLNTFLENASKREENDKQENKKVIEQSAFKGIAQGSFISLPLSIAAKGAIINVKSVDNKSFCYAVLTPLIKKHNPQRVSLFRGLQHRYDFTHLPTPTPILAITAFEKRNNISINVFKLDADDTIFPVKIVKAELPDHRDLLLIKHRDGAPHYCYIKNFNKLIRAQITSDRRRMFTCKRCFTHFQVHGASRIKEHQRCCNGF